ncbi:MAG: luciferase family protein [Anaerolineaceae bacterium]
MEHEHNSLTTRSRQRPFTNKNIPHSQIGVKPVPEVNAELFRRVYSLPDVSNRPTVISVPGARAIWLNPDLALEHPEAIVSGREFAHIHPDGSLHAALPPELAREAIEKGWAEPHPLAQYLGMEGLVMLYTPQDMEELDVVFGLILDSYNFVTGRNLLPENVFSNIASGEK